MEKRESWVLAWARSRYKDILSFIVTVLGMLVTVVVSLISSTDTLREIIASLERISFIVLGFILLLGAFTLLLMRAQRGSSKVVHLREGLQNSFLKALDDSPLNPNRSERGQNA
jgi:cytochrome c biogenesis protein CcdA